MEASRIGNVEIARLLLDRADPNLTNNVRHNCLCSRTKSLKLLNVCIVSYSAGRLDCTNGSSKQWKIWHCGYSTRERGNA